MIVAIAVSFVAGIVVSPNMATAHLDMCAQPSANSLKSVWHALCDLQTEIDNIPTGYPGIGNIMIKTIEDCSPNCESPNGWNPPTKLNIITDPDVKSDSFIAIMIQNTDKGGCTVFRGTFGGEPLKNDQFVVDCLDNRNEGAKLTYLIINP